MIASPGGADPPGGVGYMCTSTHCATRARRRPSCLGWHTRRESSKMYMAHPSSLPPWCGRKWAWPSMCHFGLQDPFSLKTCDCDQLVLRNTDAVMTAWFLHGLVFRTNRKLLETRDSVGRAAAVTFMATNMYSFGKYC